MGSNCAYGTVAPAVSRGANIVDMAKGKKGFGGVYFGAGVGTGKKCVALNEESENTRTMYADVAFLNTGAQIYLQDTSGFAFMGGSAMHQTTFDTLNAYLNGLGYQLVRQDGSAAQAADLVTPAMILARNWGLFDVANAGGLLIVADYTSTRGREIDLKTQDSAGGASLVLGYGKEIGRFYLGIEFMQRMERDTKADNGKVFVKGFIPTLAVRIGMMAGDSWLFYAKLGGACCLMKAYARSVRTLEPLVGFGIEKAVGNWTVRLDCDAAGANRVHWIKNDMLAEWNGPTGVLQVAAAPLAGGAPAGGNPHIIPGANAQGPGGAPLGAGNVPVLMPPPPDNYSQSVKIKRRCNFSARIIFSYRI
jgi:hypothetical protein